MERSGSACWAAVGSFGGQRTAPHIVLLLSDQVLRTMMLIILPVAAVLILWRRDLPDENRDDGTLNAKKAVLALAIGLGIGLYDGIFGPGTGTFAIIAFTTLMALICARRAATPRCSTLPATTPAL